MLVKSKFLEYLDISYNCIDSNTLYCLCFGLSLSYSIQYVSVEGNKFGHLGLRMLMNANCTNPNTEFKINSKNCGSEIDAATDNQIKLFTPSSPEGPYRLDLTVIYDQIVLQRLLTISFGLVAQSAEHPDGPFEHKQCFNGVKLDKKPKWEVPTERDGQGVWNIGGDEAKGILEFYFTCDPHQYKKDMRAINKKLAAAEAEGKKITDVKQLKPAPKEIISV